MPSSSGSPALSCPFLQPRGNSTSVLRKRSPVTTGKGIQMKFLTTAAVAAAFVFGAHAAHAGATFDAVKAKGFLRSEEHTSELQSLMRKSYAVFCLTKKIISYK